MFESQSVVVGRVRRTGGTNNDGSSTVHSQRKATLLIYIKKSIESIIIIITNHCVHEKRKKLTFLLWSDSTSMVWFHPRYLYGHHITYAGMMVNHDEIKNTNTSTNTTNHSHYSCYWSRMVERRKQPTSDSFVRVIFFLWCVCRMILPLMIVKNENWIIE